ncbi:MAG: transglutaminase family protein [Thermosynechococcaceae cyanobacterium]
MKYAITHRTVYTYPQSVVLNPHTLRLCPRTDGFQRLQDYRLQIDPAPQGQTQLLDAEGNTATRCWWGDTPVTTLAIESIATVETLCSNPFSYLLEPWATQLPLDYPVALLGSLHAYLQPLPFSSLAPDPTATQLAQEIAHAVHWNTAHFLSELNQRIYRQLQYQVREVGHPLPPSLTWSQQSGSCRDFVVLFMAACQAVGLAARFVSGYEEGDPAYEQVLHAWVEVYLPGAGWRGYDPTLGLVVSNRHVAIAASGWPRYAAPVMGTHRGGNGAPAVLHSDIAIQNLDAVPQQ